MEKIEMMTPEEAGNILHRNAETIRAGLRQGALPFGTAIRNEKNGQWNYLIVKNKFINWLELPEGEKHE